MVVDYRFERRTKTFQFLEDVTPAVLGCSISLDNSRAILRTAKFTIDAKAVTWDGLPGQAVSSPVVINPLADYLVPWHRINNGTHWIETPMGLYLLGWPQKQSDGGAETWQVDANDLGIVLAGIISGGMDGWIASVITSVSQKLQQMIVNNGLRAVIAPPAVGGDVLGADILYQPWSSTLLAELGDLATADGMYPPWFNRVGVGVSASVRDLAVRTPDVEYRDGDGGVVVTPWQESGDVTLVANTIVAIADEITRSTPLTSTAVNDSPASSISTVRLGRVIERVVRPKGVGDQAALDAVAMAELRAASMLNRKVTLTTPVDPRRDAHESYRVYASGFSDGLLFGVDSWAMTLGGMMTHQVSALTKL